MCREPLTAHLFIFMFTVRPFVGGIALSFVYPKETPPDIFIFLSWHLRRPYRLTAFADELWNRLTSETSVGDVIAEGTNPNKTHNTVHESFRKYFDELPKFNENMPYLDPNPEYIGRTVKEFVDYYLKRHPDAISNKPPVADAQPQQDVKLAGDGDESIPPVVSNPSPELNTSPAKKRGRPAKVS